MTINNDVYADPFIKDLLERLPEDKRELFDEQQLLALKSILGIGQKSTHSIDLRGTFKFWRWRYYFVFLTGVNRREPGRIVKELEFWGKTVLFFSFITFSVLLGLLTLYLIKSAMGIDLIPGFSLGIWGAFQDAFLR